MKLYIPDIDINKINKDLISDYIDKKYKKIYLYSESGIYSIINNRLYKNIINDSEIEGYFINNIKCLIDNSNIKKIDYYQIPYYHVNYEYDIIEYILGKKASVKLILELYNDKIIDFYFLLKNKNEYICEDILTFLSYLTFI